MEGLMAETEGAEEGFFFRQWMIFIPLRPIEQRKFFVLTMA